MSFRKPYAVTRASVGEYVDGNFVPGSTSAVPITATIQPATLEDQIVLPAGKRLSDYVRVYTSTELLTAAEESGQQPDQLTWHGHTYECISVGAHQMDVISHWKCIFSKVSQA